MPVWRLRDFQNDDLDQAIQIWDQSRIPGSSEPVFTLAEVMAAARAGQPAVVATVGDELVGMAVAQVHGERAWILLVALGSRWRNRGIGSALLANLERRLRSAGAHRISAVMPMPPPDPRRSSTRDTSVATASSITNCSNRWARTRLCSVSSAAG